jgi:hypothetical protein
MIYSSINSPLFEIHQTIDNDTSTLEVVKETFLQLSEKASDVTNLEEKKRISDSLLRSALN